MGTFDAFIIDDAWAPTPYQRKYLCYHEYFESEYIYIYIYIYILQGGVCYYWFNALRIHQTDFKKKRLIWSFLVLVVFEGFFICEYVRLSLCAFEFYCDFCMCRCLHIHIYVYMRILLHASSHTHTHTHTHTYIYIYIHGRKIEAKKSATKEECVSR